MSRVKTINLSGVTADADGIAASQTPAAGGEQSLTLAGNPPVTMLVDITSAGNDSARTFVVTGTDRYDEVISETVNPGPNSGTVQTTKQFKTVTSITVDDDTAGAITVGWAAVVYSRWLPLETTFKQIEVGVGVDVTGTVDFDLEYTLRGIQGRENNTDKFDPLQYGDIEALLATEAFVDADIDGDTASIFKTFTARATAIRFKMNSGTGSIVVRITEAENR